MANITVKYLIGIVAEILQDESTDSTERGWTEETLVDYYNLTARRIVSLSPSANQITKAVKLASGTKQSIPSGGITFLNAIRNMGIDGETPGLAITPTLRSVITSFDLNWSTAVAVVAIYNIWPSTEDKRTFYNYPPSDGTGYIQIEYSAVPPIIVWEDGGDWEDALVGVTDEFINALIKGMLALTYNKDTDYPGNAERSATYEASFLNTLSAV